MKIDQFGYKTIVELQEDNYYLNNHYYHALKDAKTSIDIDYLQNQVRQMTKDRKKE